MKKTTVISALMAAFAISANAQFKVQSDGKIAIQTTSTALSPISINGEGHSDYHLSLNTNVGKSGILVDAYGTGSGTVYGGNFCSTLNYKSIGLRGSATSSDNCIAVLAISGCGTKTIGVLGDIQYGNHGAAIYGTTYGDFGNALTSGFYAGFFNGNVKVTGYIDGVLLGDESSSSSGSSASGSSLRSISVSKNLSGLAATTYQKERPVFTEGTDSFDTINGDMLQRSEPPKQDVMEEQFYKKNHFALDADCLEKSFPDLVYVRTDGSKAINYMEMIPLLVQSINELNAEIEQLKSQTLEETINASRFTTNNEDMSLDKNFLYQNTPNPFKEQTTIRFSLADDARDASICIFDMTGKMLKNLPISSGDASVSLNGWELGEGMFLYTLIVNGKEIDTKRMIIFK